jgi:hypothetical protein
MGGLVAKLLPWVFLPELVGSGMAKILVVNSGALGCSVGTGLLA